MGNMGAFITMNGKDLVPNFTSYEAVVSIFLFNLKTIFLTQYNSKRDDEAMPLV